MEDLAPAFPLLTALEAGVSTHQLCQERVQLVFRPEVELQCVHEGDEGLAEDQLHSS